MRWRLVGSRRHSSSFRPITTAPSTSPIAKVLFDRADVDDKRASRHLGGETGGSDPIQMPPCLLQYFVDARRLHRSPSHGTQHRPTHSRSQLTGTTGGFARPDPD